MKKFLIPLLVLFFLGNHTRKNSTSYIINNLDPPKKYYEIEGGSCGEACLWTILAHNNKKISQSDINRKGGSPGRGLYSNELFYVLNKYKIKYVNISKKVFDYNAILIELIQNIKTGNPILLGVKIYPDNYPRWACDHFILLVGYNEKTKEIIYNSDNERKKIKADKFLNKSKGYSIMSSHNYLFAVKFIR